MSNIKIIEKWLRMQNRNILLNKFSDNEYIVTQGSAIYRFDSFRDVMRYFEIDKSDIIECLRLCGRLKTDFSIDSI